MLLETAARCADPKRTLIGLSSTLDANAASGRRRKQGFLSAKLKESTPVIYGPVHALSSPAEFPSILQSSTLLSMPDDEETINVEYHTRKG